MPIGGLDLPVRDVVIVVVAVYVFVPPIVLFDGRVDLLGNFFAGEAANDAADNRSDRGADRPSQGSCSNAGRGAADGRANPSSNGMGAGLAGDGISIVVAFQKLIRALVAPRPRASRI